MPEYRQAKRRLGDEDVAGHQLERRAGRVRRILVIAGGDDAGVLANDRDLRRTEHMACGVKLYPDVTEPDLLAIADDLRRAGKVFAITQPHHVQRFLRRQHRAMAGAGMVGMAVGNHGPLHGTDGVDMEAAGFAAKAARGWQQDVLRTHDCHIGSKRSKLSCHARA